MSSVLRCVVSPSIRCTRLAIGVAAGSILPLLGVHAAIAQTTWVGNGSNPYWDIASNWSTDTVPGSGVNVVNSTGNTIIHRQNTDTVNSFLSDDFAAFQITGGILNIVSSFTTNGAFSMTGGTMNAGSFTSTATSGIKLSNSTLNVSGLLTTGSSLTMEGATIQKCHHCQSSESHLRQQL